MLSARSPQLYEKLSVLMIAKYELVFDVVLPRTEFMSYVALNAIVSGTQGKTATQTKKHVPFALKNTVLTTVRISKMSQNISVPIVAISIILNSA